MRIASIAARVGGSRSASEVDRAGWKRYTSPQSRAKLESLSIVALFMTFPEFVSLGMLSNGVDATSSYPASTRGF